MARNKTIFLYNDTQQNQEWTVYSEGVINKTYTVGQQRMSFTISVSGDVDIQFGVNNTVYLTANYRYATDDWRSQTNTPNEISFSETLNAVNVTSSYTPEA